MHNIYIFVYKLQMDIIKNLKSKEKLQEKARKRYQNLSEGQEKKIVSIIANNQTISLKMK